MNDGVTWSGSPNQNASTSGSSMPAFAISRIREPSSARTAWRAMGGCMRGGDDRGFYRLDRGRSLDRDLERIPPVPLRGVERAVGPLEQRLGRRGVALAERDADAGRHLDRRVAREERRAHRGDDLARDEAALLARVDALEDDDELVAGEPRDEIGGPHRRREAPRELAQHVVAGRVPERVVDALEAVDVEEQQRDLRPAALRA